MTPLHDDSPEDGSLHRLPSHDADPVLVERLRRRAHAVIRQHESRVHSRWIGHYYRFVEPTVLLALGMSYLVASFQVTIALFQ
jgi:hypothetical protein